MTSQTKKFIEVSDILAFRFQCKCGSMIVTPIEGYKEMPIACTNCGHSFYDVNNDSIPRMFKSVITALHQAQLTAKNRNFGFSLEITGDPETLSRP